MQVLHLQKKNLRSVCLTWINLNSKHHPAQNKTPYSISKRAQKISGKIQLKVYLLSPHQKKKSLLPDHWWCKLKELIVQTMKCRLTLLKKEINNNFLMLYLAQFKQLGPLISNNRTTQHKQKVQGAFKSTDTNHKIFTQLFLSLNKVRCINRLMKIETMYYSINKQGK